MGRREYRRNDVNPDTPAPDPRAVAPAPVPLPGGRVNITRHAEEHQTPDIGPPVPYFRGIMAHGVASRPHHPQAAKAGRAASQATKAADLPEPPAAELPVPVYIVPLAGGNRPLKKASAIRVPVPAAGAQPVPLCGRDLHRTRVQLLNESATVIRLVDGPTAQVTPGGNGAALPASMTGYLPIDTQEAIYAIADSGAATLYVSVISEYTVPGGS